MGWSIHQVARMSGVTARTLRYYDEINLLPPAEVAANGYRHYDDKQLLRLQQILLMRELRIDLATIKAVVDEQRDPADTLRTHHRQLLAERERLDQLAATAAATIRQLKSGDDTSAENLFAAMTPERATYLTGLAKKRVAASALFGNTENGTLLVKPTYKDHWQLPGGVTEADEGPLAAATRAVRRELGMPVALGRLLAVDWVAPRADGNAIEGLLFIFDAPSLSPEHQQAINLPADELEDWAWCDERQQRERLPAHMLHRITAARTARTANTTLYLVNGTAVNGFASQPACPRRRETESAASRFCSNSKQVRTRRLLQFCQSSRTNITWVPPCPS